MDRNSDLVIDSRLDTRFESTFTVHLFRDHTDGRRRHTVIREEYWRRERRVGGGASGVVWLEKCVRGRRDLVVRAVKQITSKPVKDGKSIDYARELEAFAKFSQPQYADCFVKSFGWYAADEMLFITMEYLPHGDLEQYVQDSLSLPEQDVADITCQILEGVSHMHENRFAHRDLKPANILVKSCPPEHWWVKIGDFGISKRLENETSQSTLLKGTPGFIAPELYGFVPQVTLFAADMWALGEITFQLMTKQPVFENVGSLSDYAHGRHAFPTTPLLTHKVSLNGEDFITSLMDPLPQRRLNAEQAQKHDWISRFLETYVVSPASAHPRTSISASMAEDSAWRSVNPPADSPIEALGTWTTHTQPFSVVAEDTITTETPTITEQDTEKTMISYTATSKEKDIEKTLTDDHPTLTEEESEKSITNNTSTFTQEDVKTDEPPAYNETVPEVNYRFTKMPKISPRWYRYARYAIGNITIQDLEDLYKEARQKRQHL